MSQDQDLTLRIRRYDPSTGRSWLQEYRVRAGGILRFTDLLRKINTEQDPTLAWNSSCEHGQCGSCAVRVNGKPLLACELLVENAVKEFETKEFLIEPITVGPVVRDLVVDLEVAYRRVEGMKPFIIRPRENPYGEGEYRIDPKEMDPYVDATRCINCFCCATACISGPRSFVGPNAIMSCVVRLLDPREDAKAERFKLLHGPNGVAHCHTSKACSHVCPKEIDVAHFVRLAKSLRLKEKA